MPARSHSRSHEVAFTHLEKIFFPKDGFTKGDMIKYYLDVAPYLLPHLKNRPVTLIRFPDGVTGQRFYAKNAPAFTPAWIKTFAVPRRRHDGEVNYILINDAPTLGWCANLGALELHPFLHRSPAIDKPTHIAFDLDPGDGADILACVRVALLVKEILDELGLESFPKVSGSKGLQLYVPLNTRVTYAATGTFAKAVAELLEQQHPGLVVSRMDKVRRVKKVLIDWSQNSVSKTTVAVYSLRGKRDEPFVSLPVSWLELQKALRTKKPQALFFTPDAALMRLEKNGDLFAPVLTLKQTLPKAFVGRTAPAAPDEALSRYRAKRDFSRTAEPPPRPATVARAANNGGRFVIQKHAASHLHYDFRLEMDGVLKSWAVPKGVPAELGVKRAAIEVEDHPLDYLNFEGTIPKGQYGGGTVMVWDIGTYELTDGGLRQGDLKLTLHGEKLKGDWHLFRIRSEEGKPVWLLVKHGKAMRAIGARRDDTSVLSGRSMKKIAADNDAQWPSRTQS
jgi:bifunctional non-homologous end joining protein LigD